MIDPTHQPRYHLHPPTGWMNDPNGAIQYQGQYHLFYQHNPNGAFSASKHWAHVASRDLLHWEELPIALAPQPGSYDKEGCFSGCAVVHNDLPTLIYTGVFPEVQCLATSADGMTTWQKHPANPVLHAPPAGLEVTGFRDPYAWRGADGLWYILVGSGLRGQGGTALLYSSPDLSHWTYLNPLCVGVAAENGRMWNCPSFFPLGGQHVLVVSGQPVWKPFFFAGDFDGRRLTPRTSGLVDYGGNLYAPQVFMDESGRVILWGWIWDARPDDEILAAGWSGVMALPRLLSLNADGSVASHPAPEVTALRGAHASLPAQTLPQGNLPISNLRGASCEILARFTPGSAQRFGLRVLCAPDGTQHTTIGYDAPSRQVFIDRSQAGLQPRMAFGWPNPPHHAAPLPLAEGEPLELRVFLDQSVIEVFTNRGLALSSRVYPRQPQSCTAALFAEGGSAHLQGLDYWQLSFT